MSKEYVRPKLPSAYCGISCAMDDNDVDEYVIVDHGTQITDFHRAEADAWDEVAARLRSKQA